MNEPYFRKILHPELKNPLLIVGLPSFGDIGRTVARLLIDTTEAKLFTELYSPSFPDYVIVDGNGICRPPKYEFYYSSIGERTPIILTGDSYPSIDDLKAYYVLCDEILNFVEMYGCRFIITIGGTPMPSSERGVYVAASSPKLASEVVKRGASIYRGGRIVDTSGFMLGLAKNRGWMGICLLGATIGLGTDKDAAFLVFRLLTRILKEDLGTNI